MLAGKRILLIIGGGIAAYKALDLIRRLRERGAAVTPVMTRAAAQFYGAAVTLASQAKNLPPVLVEYVRRAAESRDRIHAHIEAHLRKELAAVGYDAQSSSARGSIAFDPSRCVSSAMQKIKRSGGCKTLSSTQSEAAARSLAGNDTSPTRS